DVVLHCSQDRCKRLAITVCGTAYKWEIDRLSYIGHADSRCALGTVSSRRSSAICAAKTSSGTLGAWSMTKVYSDEPLMSTTLV
ncbi:hypothetical protein C6A85_29470, partial [Mycobacterium sp. ITM-2017-0098]